MKESIVAGFDPEAVILFGSQARGDADELSDIDMLVVLDTDEDPAELGERIARSLEHIPTEKHVIVRTPGGFLRQKDIPGAMAYPAALEGRVIYEKDGWRGGPSPEESYGERRAAVLEGEYERPAERYLALAGESLEKGQLYRCRDLARLGAIRSLKGIFAKHGLHPRREIDLVFQFERARVLEPALGWWAEFVEELSLYCPKKDDPRREDLAREMFERARDFIREVLRLYRT